MVKHRIPGYKELIQPALTALHELGGIAGTFMIDEEVVKSLKLPQQMVERTRPSQPTRSEISYRLAWARTCLKRYGLIENPQVGLWQLTPQGRRVKAVNPNEVIRHVRGARSRS